MAKTEGNTHQLLFFRHRQDSKRAPKRPTSRHPFNKTQCIDKKIIENKTVRIKIKDKDAPFHHIPITKTHDTFFRIEDLTKSIHTDQTGALPFTSQRDNRYIMVAIHLDRNYIFVKPMQSRSKKEMIWAYKKIINRMRLTGLRLKKHTLDNKALEAFKLCIQ
jgi:hypothetical protein